MTDRQGEYYVALVDLEEGPRITGQLVDFDERPESGQSVQATIRRLYVEEGVIRYGFKFQPGSGSSAP